MNQNLQNIFDVIRQNEKLSEDEKNSLLKSLKDANKELEITAFKLERTETVKRTTAILLEETIEELEQKRKAMEAQNRELEIEATLEKVRTIAMGMREPTDMLDVCKTISLQLQSLGVKEIRNVQTAIFYEQRGTYMNYEFYAKHDKTFITETVFTNNEIHNEFATKMMKGKGETFITHINGNEVKEWIEYQKTTNVFIDKYLETASSLNYYWFSLGSVALGISTYIPLAEDEINLFKRFLKVFELAYQRYLDIEKAEAQAREAQIEASLEKVRAVAMSMNKSEDLLSICEVSFKEFKKLGFDYIRNALIHIQYDEQKYFMDYDFSDLTDGAITKIEYGSHPVVEEYLMQIRSAKDAFYQGIIKEDQLEEWKGFRRKSGQIDDPRLEKATALYYYFFSIGIGDIGISTLQPINESQIKILKRFRNVFDLAYRRYNDITLAEAQARETQIQLALERVRARTMAMHKSEELSETSFVLFQQFVELGIVPNRFFIGSVNEKENIFDVWITQWGGEMSSQNFKVNIEEPVQWRKVYKAWEAQEKSLVVDINGEDLIKWNEYLESIGLSVENRKSVTCIVNSFAIFSRGFIAITTPEVAAEETVRILERFATVFDGTYTRFLDLKNAEAQTREAQIEAALERVRSRTMAMQQSEELAETAAVVFKQLIHLGIEPNRIYIGIIKDDLGNVEFWITDEDGSKVSSGFTTNLNDNSSFKKMYEGWREQKKSLTIDMQEKVLEEYFHHLTKLNIPFKDGLSQKRRIQTIAYFSRGFIGIASAVETKSETIQLLERFAAVFNLTYTRFNDLKQAEAQNKIIKADNDRKTKELEEARQLQLSMLPKELPKLPNLQIAAFMRTATEVGGDYYDFIVQENGTLNVGFGDATGHGLQAGTMITLMKGLFTSDSSKLGPKEFMSHCTRVIKDIKLGRILMSFSYLKIDNHKIQITSAGMPPIYYHSKKNNRTEEITIQGMPLGAMLNSSYNIIEKELNSGDTILLLTDGLPEQLNSKHVMFDYSRIQKYFSEIAEYPPEEIINSLVKKADDWRGGTPQTDDITFVVIKVT